MMKTNLTVISHVSSGVLCIYNSSSRLVLLYKKDCATLLHLCYTCYLLPVTKYLITKLPVTDNFSACREYLLKTAYHFLLLPVGFDTLTYRKHYDRSPILVGHQDSFLAPLPGSEAPLVRKHLYSVLKFAVTCYYGK